MDKRLLSTAALPSLMLPQPPALVLPERPKPVFHTRAQRRQHDKEAKSRGLLPIVAVNGFLTVQAPNKPIKRLYWADTGAHLRAGELPGGTKVIIDCETGACRRPINGE